MARVVSERGLSAAATPKCAAFDPDQLRSAREDIKELLKNNFCHPILCPLKKMTRIQAYGFLTTTIMNRCFQCSTKEHVVGWYSTGPKLPDNDLEVHRLFHK
ncbi:hypothetical protein FH972_008632 [Carpinus fangiana]|uniref:JAB1/MPN/MOV34 metalloenzyme domain-containing protein n=1 Tax=Carpinus fangiana TaxID=176857 RepID=A0A5N6R2E2_9ROSI|nr:hypothetical protein FH972_008632 [Carpinus fangiana]